MNDALAKLNVTGDPNAVDSFAACLQAVMRAWGDPVEYWYVAGLLGTSFSPVWNKGEQCVGWMVDGGSDLRVEAAGKALGFTATRIKTGQEMKDQVLDDYIKNRKLHPRAKEYFDALRTALDEGKMVIPLTWPAWSVLAGWNEDLAELPYVTTPGFAETVNSIYPPIRAHLAYILARTTVPVDRRASVVKEALRFGATVASGTFSAPDMIFGGAMYDTAASITKGQYLCPGCRENGCFGRTVKRLVDGQEASAAFLKAAMDVVGDGNRKAMLETAAHHYTEMAMATRRYIDWPAFKDHYDKPEFRSRLAADVAAIKQKHVAAAQTLGELAATL